MKPETHHRRIVESVVPSDRIPLIAVARELGINPATVHRWRNPGRGGHRLKCWKLGLKLYTCPRSLADFLAKVNGHDRSPSAPPKAPEPGPRRETVMRELAQDGLVPPPRETRPQRP